MYHTDDIIVSRVVYRNTHLAPFLCFISSIKHFVRFNMGNIFSYGSNVRVSWDALNIKTTYRIKLFNAVHLVNRSVSNNNIVKVD